MDQKASDDDGYNLTYERQESTEQLAQRMEQQNKGAAAEAEQSDHNPEGWPRDHHHLGPRHARLPLCDPRQHKWHRRRHR